MHSRSRCSTADLHRRLALRATAACFYHPVRAGDRHRAAARQPLGEQTVMLEAIRKRAGSLVVKILFLFLVLSFGIWGIADVFRPGRGADWAAEVGGVKISTAAFQEEYRDALRRLGQALGSPVEAEQARALGLPNSVLDRMIEGVLFDRAAADLGVTLTDAMVREQIKSDPRFRNQAGAFDPDVFRPIAASQRIQPGPVRRSAPPRAATPAARRQHHRRHRAAAKPGRSDGPIPGASGASPSTRSSPMPG